MDERAKISTGPNEAATGESIAGTGRGRPDDAATPGSPDLPPPPTDEEVARVARKLGAPIAPVSTDGEMERT